MGRSKCREEIWSLWPGEGTGRGDVEEEGS